MRRVFQLIVFSSFHLAESFAVETAPPRDAAARQYLALIENFSGFAEEHWNEKAESYDAAGSGVTWARGNGGVCLVNAALLTEFPDRPKFSPREVPREIMLDHTRRTIRKLCLTNANCTDPRAQKVGAWGGIDPKNKAWHWQAGLETEHWVVAAKLLADQLDDDTKSLVRQVATAEADGAIREIPSAKKGNTAADDCSWNAGILGVCAAIYADDPRAAKWDEWAKRWALNMEAREPDRESSRMIDGKPLGEWLVSTNVFPDLTLENHGFWDLPYQFGFAALAEPVIAYRLCGRKIPAAFQANAVEAGNHIFRWLVMPDGDLLCPQGIDWAERDVQHSWGFTVLGTLLDQRWALAAEQRCLKLLASRQAAFGDGSIHALDFGYETDLAVVWTFSFLFHKHFPKADSGLAFDEPNGSKLFPYVATAVHRTPDFVSSVTWFRSRQAIMVSPNNSDALADRPAFTRYDKESGTGWIALPGDKKHRAFRVVAEPIIREHDGSLSVSFAREIPGVARQDIGYCALPGGEVAVFSRWHAIQQVSIAELVDHPFRWVRIEKFIPDPDVRQSSPGIWNIDGKLQIRVLDADPGELVADGVNGSVRRNFTAKAGEIFHNSVCVYEPLVAGHQARELKQTAKMLQLGDWRIRRDDDDGSVTATRAVADKDE